ncbi:hypothetical protein [Aurantiacibacter rhizosphaerae]|uniref:Uncharacterized protein n=1 Tax=Aurantiacibacter rhizosphaerae TaxID=2691582 RepID=A0A844XE23_9SPHN|nr:hypothetical protein [Aurantiacibacter rhizosphaerae]MWV28090.1 hypothetical protein [Aurantiacibacter rhizosphaerae]
MLKHHFALPIALFVTTALSACSAEPEVDNDTDLAAEDEEAEIARESLNAGDFADLQLGAKIVGPQGEEVKGRLTNETGAFADITSFVACPAGMDECDPATAPEGTIYTYVHTVYPGEDNDPSTGSGDGNDASNVETTEAFRMTMPSHGFTGSAGFSYAEAANAITDRMLIVATCHEQGIAWTVEEGDGGDQWGQGEPITFYWQSTLPPAGPADAYEVFANYTAASGPGPYPAASDTATNACVNSAVTNAQGG